jgi:benzoate-CoA ligase
VVGYSDGNQLVKPAAYVVLKNGKAGGSELAEELKELIASKLAPHKCPQRIEFIAQLPKTATGKIQRYKLREQVDG